MTEPVRMSTADGMASLWESSFDDIEPVVGSVIDPHEFLRVRALVRRYLGHQGEMFERRRAAGAVRDGHGDLTAQDIFVLDDGPRILDCLAFDDQMRISDVLADIGFLVMDVHRLAGVDAAHRLMGLYAEFTDAHHPSSLAHHYVAYRAHVRAKIEVLRHQQGVSEAADAARAYHSLAWHHLERAKLRVVLVGGGPGSGKSTLAHSIAQRTGWSVLDTDELRKDLAGIGHAESGAAAPDEGIYRPEMTDRTYTTLVEQAATLLEAGESVVLDGSWTREIHRVAVRAMAARHGAELVELECRLDPAEARRRIEDRRRRGLSASDAGPEIVDHLASRRDPWPGATPIDTSRDVGAATRDALDVALAPPSGE